MFPGGSSYSAPVSFNVTNPLLVNSFTLSASSVLVVAAALFIPNEFVSTLFCKSVLVTVAVIPDKLLAMLKAKSQVIGTLE